MHRKDPDDDDRDRKRHERDDTDHFSQRDDDRAGRRWHGMNSDYEIEDVGRFHPDDDVREEDERDRQRTRGRS